jgi:type IV secretory pathway VirD2 relaxase
MTRDDDLRPKLGRVGAGGKPGRQYLHQVLRATMLAGGRALGRVSKFHGGRIGRGAAVGRMLSSRDRYAALRSRRTIVKSRIVKLAGKGLQGAAAHLRYIQRDGVTRDGQPGLLYDAGQDQADGKAFLNRADGDRHQFRFIVSPEDGDQYEDLKPLTRRLMAQMEADLGTKLDWVAVDHFNTGHPHTHVILRGRDDRGKDLIIAKEYLTQGLRERATELVSLDLGPRTDLEIESRLRREVEQERLTSLDRRLLRDVGDDGLVAAADRDPFRQSLNVGRLCTLARLGLAEEQTPGHWKLANGLEETLRRMGERGDILKTLQRELTAKGLARSPGDSLIHLSAEEAADAGTPPMIGRVIARGLADELNDRHYLIVDGVDGFSHYVEIGKGDATPPLPRDGIVQIDPKGLPTARAVDHAIVAVAAASGGRYSVDLHLQHDPTASERFAETHIRRLEAMRRVMGNVERSADGVWTIAADHLDRAAAFEARLRRDAPVNVRTLSMRALDQLVETNGATWLDRELTAPSPMPLRDGGFGREVQAAQVRRRQWLLAEGLAWEQDGCTLYRPDLIETLRRRELVRIGKDLTAELGRPYTEARGGERIDGVFRRTVDLADGKYAVVERSRDFTLVPWRPVLERHIGKEVSGLLRGDSISWTVGRQRGQSVS